MVGTGSARLGPPLDCQDLVELASDHLDGRLDPTVAVRVDDHLLVCESCAEYGAQLGAIAAALRQIDEPVPAALRARIVDDFRVGTRV